MTPAARLVAGLFAIACFGGEIRAQPCGKFDVASIKVNTGGAGGSYPELSPGGRRLIATNQYLMALLMFAYDVSPLQVSGVPVAFFQERYDIEATCEEPMTKEQLPHLFRSLLEERFHLSVHRELKDEPVYALIVGKGGSKLRETTHESEQPGFRQAGHSFTFINATMANLIGVLSQVAGRKVLDKTGLSAQYDFKLSYVPDNDSASRDGANVLPAANGFPDSVFTALREQLGLDLEPRKSPVEFIVVDHIEPLIPN
ncbi:MAG TPA: TIGR03435 family protein [Bryobacteraceae bacterium]